MKIEISEGKFSLSLGQEEYQDLKIFKEAITILRKDGSRSRISLPRNFNSQNIKETAEPPSNIQKIPDVRTNMEETSQKVENKPLKHEFNQNSSSISNLQFKISNFQLKKNDSDIKEKLKKLKIVEKDHKIENTPIFHYGPTLFGEYRLSVKSHNTMLDAPKGNQQN